MEIEEILNKIKKGECAHDVDVALVQKRLKLGYSQHDALNTPRVKYKLDTVLRTNKRLLKKAQIKNKFAEANEIREKYKQGTSIKELCTQYRQSRTYISKVVHNILFYNPSFH